SGATRAAKIRGSKPLGRVDCLSAGGTIKLGLVASLAQPCGNLTGINIFIVELVAKRLELLRELVPGAIRIDVLVDRTHATTTESILRYMEAVARVMGRQTQVPNASPRRETDANFATDRKVDVERLFTHRWRLEQAEEAYRLFDTQTTGKAVIL